MGMFVKFTGKLTFASEEHAKIAYDYLILTEGTVFYVFPELSHIEDLYGAKLNGKILIIDHDADSGYEEYYRNNSSLADVLGLAKSGKITGYENYGDGWTKYEISPSEDLKNKLIEKGVIAV